MMGAGPAQGSSERLLQPFRRRRGHLPHGPAAKPSGAGGSSDCGAELLFPTPSFPWEAGARRPLLRLLGTLRRGAGQATTLRAPTAKLALALRCLQQTTTRSPRPYPGLSCLAPPAPLQTAAGAQPRRRAPRGSAGRPGEAAGPLGEDPWDLSPEPRTVRLRHRGCLAPSPRRDNALSGPSLGSLRCAAAAAAAPIPRHPRQPDTRSFSETHRFIIFFPLGLDLQLGEVQEVPGSDQKGARCVAY